MAAENAEREHTAGLLVGERSVAQRARVKHVTAIRYLIRRAHLVDLAVDVPRVLPRRSAVTEVMSAGIVGDYRDFDRTVASALSVTPQRRSLPRRASSCTTHPGLHTPKLKGCPEHPSIASAGPAFRVAEGCFSTQAQVM